MKFCPTCRATYKDEELNFCLADGAALLKKRGNTPVPKNSVLNEVVAFAVLALALLVLLCLVSYSPTDPTFNTSSSAPTRNWIGPVGSNLAELLLTLVGVTAYLLPALLALVSWRIFQSESLRPTPSRVVGFCFFVLAASGLAYLIGSHGGLIGSFFAVYSIYFLSTVGAAILLITLLVLSLLLMTRLPVAWLISHVELARENLKINVRQWNNDRRARKEALRATFTPDDAEPKTRRTRDAKTQNETPTIVGRDDNATVAAAKGKLTTPPSDPFISPDVEHSDAEQIPDTVMAADRATKAGPAKRAAAKNERNESEEPVDESSPVMESDPNNFEDYELPPTDFLNEAAPQIRQNEKDLLEIAENLTEKTGEFNVSGKVVHILPGPVVTTYEFKPDPGVKYARVTGLENDLCLALEAESVRIDRIPGKAYVGIEVPNKQRETIALRDIIESKKFKNLESKLPIALGKTIDGMEYVTDLAKMPHLLIAGATGAGKSVGVNSLVVSILYRAKPDEVKFIMVDPKRLELGLYADIPHLATPIITDPKRAAISLRWAVTEMERRYKELAGWSVRNIDGYNARVKKKVADGELDDKGEPFKTLPYIVIIIDELADLMMVSGKEVEESITRLAQMARAVGIHLVLATQRPSADVITGLIKANFPARIAFRVSSKVDSRVIIDGNGAESLLGKGDMLFLPPASSQVVRVHGAYVDEKEIGKIVEHIKAQSKPEYDTTITKSEEEMSEGGDEPPGLKDELFMDALRAVVEMKRASTSALQRRLRIGYGRAAAILDAMVHEGYIGEMDGSTRARPVLDKAYEAVQDLSEMENEQ